MNDKTLNFITILVNCISHIWSWLHRWHRNIQHVLPCMVHMTVLYVIIFAIVKQLIRVALQEFGQSADWRHTGDIFRCVLWRQGAGNGRNVRDRLRVIWCHYWTGGILIHVHRKTVQLQCMIRLCFVTSLESASQTFS